MAKNKDKKSSGNWVYVLLFLVALGSCFLVAFVIWNYQHQDKELEEMPEVVESTPIPDDNRHENNDNRGEIEQDRELKFDHIVTGIPQSGVVSDDGLFDLYDEHGELPANRIERYDSSFGTVPAHSYFSSDLIAYVGNDFFISNVDNTTITVYLLEKDSRVSDVRAGVEDRYPKIGTKWLDHKGMFDYTPGEGLNDRASWGFTGEVEDKDESFNSNGTIQLIGMDYMDFTNKGYGQSMWYATYFTLQDMYTLWASIEIHEGLFLQIQVDSDSAEYLVPHVNELVNNMLIIFE